MNYRKVKDQSVVTMGYGRKGVDSSTGHGTARETLKVETPMGVAWVETGEDNEGRPFLRVELNADRERTLKPVTAKGDDGGCVAVAKGAKQGHRVNRAGFEEANPR